MLELTISGEGNQILKPTMKMRMVLYDNPDVYVGGKLERLQQLWVDVDDPKKEVWKDVPFVNDYEIDD